MDYSHLTIKDYKHWSVQVHQKQSYLGRCVIWCKRQDALDLTDANEEEQAEFFSIIRELKKATEQAFQAEWFNYSFLGNEDKHLHCHFIPRYSSPREFAGISFVDTQWGKNPYKGSGDSGEKSSPEIIEVVRLKLKEVLG